MLKILLTDWFADTYPAEWTAMQAHFLPEQLITSLDQVTMGDVVFPRYRTVPFGGTFYAEQAEDALNALHERPLTNHATNQLSIALRNKYADQDILDLLDRLNREDRLVIGSSESDELRIVCSIGVIDK